MSKGLRNKILLVLLVLGASLACAFPLEKRINLGLDLKGGMHLIINVDIEKLPEKERYDAVLRAIEILRNRIDSLGVGETVIQRQGEHQILIQLPGITDREIAKNMLRVAQLEFRLVDDDPGRLKEAIEGRTPSGYILKRLKENDEPILLEDTVALSGDTIADARVDLNTTAGFGEPYISLRLNNEGAKIFGNLTQNNVNRQLAIILDSEVISAPNIQEAIWGGNAQITGRFTFQEASILALALRSGALPAPMHIEEERTIGPLLGKDSINAGIKATIMGASLVFGFMLIYYLMAGLIADIALALNLVLILGIMGFLRLTLPESPMTLTLPGIAGIILTLGMAVDANVLINERIREEIKLGRPLSSAIHTGFSKALKAIIDSNVTTLIAAFMLFQFGSGPIKGFAVTLTIGLISSLFTAVFVSKTIFQLFLEWKLIKTLPMLSFFGETKFNFISKKFIFCILSIIVIAVGMFGLIKKNERAYGIDFAGGQIQEYRFNRALKAEEIRTALNKIELNNAIIQQYDQYPENVIIRTPEDTYEKVSIVLKESFPDNSFETLRVERVGPVVGKALRQRAFLAIILAMGGILIYVGFRFKHFDFAAGGVIALIHDVIVALGLTVLLNREIDLMMISALLTIAGYSINDTIVIYDRVRENLVNAKKMNLAEIINLSINQTLGRTILTTGATLLVVIALYFFGGEVLNSFALCLLIGFMAGTYSTVFIASPIVLAMQRKKIAHV